MKYDITKEPTRGAKRTLEAFRNEMFRLLTEKAFEDIAVNEICFKTDFPRATFYNYFDDKYDLLDYCWQRLGEQVRLDEYPLASPSMSLHIYFNRMWDIAEKYKEVLWKILRNNTKTSYMYSSFRNYLISQIRTLSNSCASVREYKIPQEIIADHCGNALLLVFEWCYCKGNSCPREKAYEYLQYLIGDL